MIVTYLVLLSFLISSTRGLNEDMIATGYLQDPALVGQLPSEFEEDIMDTDHGYNIDDTIEEDYQGVSIDQRSLQDDINSLEDAEMRSQLEGYCKTEEGKADDVCKTTK